MHLILTHEQADFDAMAALLAAHLLNEHAIPVLPRKTNRNVRAFLTLYGAELPFVEPRDLPNEPVERVTLVDTQAMATIKGVGPRTPVNIIDHHQQRADLPAGWTLTSDRVGACTTLLVEALHEHNGGLAPIHATLLLLGIYEDTGSLTYISTTPRDVRSAASLLEQGASLRIASEFLNPPLSAEQRVLYDQMLALAETHHIHGQSVMIASATADTMTEEVSSIAHKLRDLLDPDALFLIVSTPEGVRIVARSTSDQINVAEITAHFGGGGHERAAAALLHPTPPRPGEESLSPLERIKHELVSLLPRYVRPSVTVKQLMSRRPLVLSPHTSAQEAAQLMQRYGYEGYPVVKDGRVIGLLTRRSVDRALAHKLNLTASSLMDAGEVFIHPGDPLEALQRVMTTSGWGQVPVVDPDSGKIVGIVTRTDLLKTLSEGEERLPAQQNQAARLEAALPPARLELLKAIAAQARELHQAVYIVGGFVRDLILDRPSQDFDVVVEGDAIALGNALVARYGGRIVSHARFGTAKWWVAEVREELALRLPNLRTRDAADLPVSLDLITARTEFYDYPTALPTVERGSIKLDLHRRDFTFNTMALRLDGRHYGDLYDFWGGLNDLRRGLVRVLHSLSFVDDPTRMLRAVRFEQRFGFQIDPRTLQLMEEARPLLRQVSGDRLRHELDLMLAEEAPARMLSRLQELHLLAPIHPDLHWDDDRAPALERVLHGELDPLWKLPEVMGHNPIRRVLGYLVWLGLLPQENIANITARLRLPGDLTAALGEMSRLWPDLPRLDGMSPSQVVARLDSTPLPALVAVLLLNPPQAARQTIEQYLREWRGVQPSVNGNDLRTLQIKPGPSYRSILSALRTAWLDGQISSETEERALLLKLLQQMNSEEP